MSIIGLIVTLAVFGFILWLIVNYIPMVEPVKRIIIGVAVVCLILWLLSAFGMLGSLNAPIRFR